MEMRLLGQTGESLSVIGFGAMVFVKEGPEFARNSVARAIDSGINYFIWAHLMVKERQRKGLGLP